MEINKNKVRSFKDNLPKVIFYKRIILDYIEFEKHLTKKLEGHFNRIETYDTKGKKLDINLEKQVVTVY